MYRYLLTAALSLLVSPAAAQTAVGDKPADELKDVQPSTVVLPALDLQGTTSVMFATLVRQVGLSGGVAVSNPECSQAPVGSISIESGMRLDKALSQVVQIRALSEWQLRDGVVDVLPASIPPLLLVRVHRFEWNVAAPAKEVIVHLFRFPEVSEAVAKLGLKEAPFEGGAGSICIRDCDQKPKPETAPKIEEDVTLLTVLNRIVRAHDRAVWQYSEYRCQGGVQFSVGILAE